MFLTIFSFLSYARQVPLEENPYPPERKDTNWSVMVRCFPFLEYTFERDDVWWTASTSTDGANGPNRKCLAGLGVEKLRGECTPLWFRSVAQMGHGARKFCNCTFFHGESLVQVSDNFLQCKDTLLNAFERRK